MAARFWVGGTGNWDASDTTHWAATSNGAGGQSVPTASDTVTLDANSGGGTVTVTATATCSSLTCGAFTGTFDTNDQAVNVTGTFTISGTGTRTITLGSSAISCGTWTATTTTGLTWNAETSVITQTGNTTFNGGALTYYGVLLTGDNPRISGSNNYTNLTRTGTATNLNTLTITSGTTQTVSGVCKITGNSAINRLLVKVSTPGTSATIHATAWTDTANVDFQDITSTDAIDLSAITGGSGNCGGCTGITFTTADTWYWHADTGNVSDYTKWYTETNGGGSQMASTRVPLPQDTLRFDDSSFTAGSKTVTQNMPRIGSIDFTGATNTPTFTTSTVASVFGSIKLISGMTLTASAQAYTFEGRGSYTLDSGGKTWEKAIILNCVTGTGSVTLKSDITFSGNKSLTITTGTFNCVDGVNNWAILNAYYINVATNGAITLGSATHTMTAPEATFFYGNGTINAFTGTLKYIGAMTNSVTFAGGTKTYGNLWIASTNNFPVIITGSNDFADFKIDAGREVNFTDGTDQTVTTLTAIGTSDSPITMHGTGTAGWKISDTAGTNDCDWLVLNYSTAEGGAIFNATNTTGANNSGWNITAPSTANTTNFFHFI